MSKRVILIAAILFSIVLTGCNKEKEIISTSTIYSGISPMAEGSLVEMDENHILNYYGIDTADLQEYVFAKSDDPKSAETIIMFRCDDKDKIKEYATVINNSLKQREDELTNYNLPEEAKLVKNAKVTKKGDFVYLVISDKSDEMTKIIKDSI